jgi:hypothetical protein
MAQFDDVAIKEYPSIGQTLRKPQQKLKNILDHPIKIH